MSFFGSRIIGNNQGKYPHQIQHELALEGLSMALDKRVEDMGKVTRVLSKIRNHFRKKASRYLRVLHEQNNGGVPLWKRAIGMGVSKNPRHLHDIGKAYRTTSAPSQAKANDHVLRIEEFLLLLEDEVRRTEEDGWDTLSAEYRTKLSVLLTQYASHASRPPNVMPSAREPYWHIRAAWAEVCGALSRVLADSSGQRIQGQIDAMRQALAHC